MSEQTTPNNVFMRTKDVCEYLGISRTTLYMIHEHDESFPRKLRLNQRCVGWYKPLLDDWLMKKSGLKEALS